ncbi:uncharacterized protein LOC106151315 [Lingula anatina]|uniref:Uncharacterized protein LOC106151315 n=1 Tax=Lingula anatina TaxID=7574 RepID=A0A1S3H214_LINAN|nr:uncharacterized protein LOC106151315 [Lingula anatina]|eukprot:XP_013379982.1 uncharacterized protein LOC106151315 [Lingula anatina]
MNMDPKSGCPLTEESLLAKLSPEDRSRLLSDNLTGKWWYKGWATLLKCYREDEDLTMAGRMIIETRWTEVLQNRLAIARKLPLVDVSKCPIQRPIFIIGPCRTGTTFLLNLLYQDPNNTSPRYYETMHPVVETPILIEREDPRVEAERKALTQMYEAVPKVKVMHNIVADNPYECYRLMDNCGIFKANTFLANNPEEYLAWLSSLSEEEKEDAYRFHKLQIQLILLARGSDDTNKQLVFKESTHSLYLDAILKVYPDATFIHTYRDPCETIASLCSMAATYKGLAYDPASLDLKKIGENMVAIPLFHSGLNMMAFRKSHPEEEHRFCDIAYSDIVKDPLNVVKRIYDRFGLELTAEGEAIMAAYIKDNPQNKYGRHHHSLERYQLTKEYILDYFNEYIEFSEVRC